MFLPQDKDLIKELNLQHLPEERQARQLQTFYETLHTKLSMAIEDALSDEQLLEFEKISDVGDDVAAKQWLEHAIPHYDKLLAAETEAFKTEIKKNAAAYRSIINEQ